MRKFLLYIFVIFHILIFHISTSKAALWQLDAAAGITTLTDFWIQFDDQSPFNTVVITEITSFSGVETIITNPELHSYYTDVTVLPDITVGGFNFNPGGGDDWGFAPTTEPGGEFYAATSWIYGVSAVVPIPSAVWLLGSGLIGIVGVRRKFKT